MTYIHRKIVFHICLKLEKIGNMLTSSQINYLEYFLSIYVLFKAFFNRLAIYRHTEEWFRLSIMRDTFPMRTVRHWSRLSLEAVLSTSLENFKSGVYQTLSRLGWHQGWFCFGQGVELATFLPEFFCDPMKFKWHSKQNTIAETEMTRMWLSNFIKLLIGNRIILKVTSNMWNHFQHWTAESFPLRSITLFPHLRLRKLIRVSRNTAVFLLLTSALKDGNILKINRENFAQIIAL